MRIKKKDIDRIIEILQKLKIESFNDENSEIEFIGNKIKKYNIPKKWYVVWDKTIGENINFLNRYYNRNFGYIEDAVTTCNFSANQEDRPVYFSHYDSFLRKSNISEYTRITSKEFIELAKSYIYGS